MVHVAYNAWLVSPIYAVAICRITYYMIYKNMYYTNVLIGLAELPPTAVLAKFQTELQDVHLDVVTQY